MTGSVWDLLFLPGLFLEKKPLRVLVLGVGGGAVMHACRQHLDVESVIGVDIDAMHLKLAERFFDLKGRVFELVEADAIDYVAQYQGEKFDLIIDDVFSEVQGEPEKVAQADRLWFLRLYGILAHRGVLVMNFVGQDKALSSAALHDALVKCFLPHAMHLTTPFYDNHVLAFSSKVMQEQMIHSALASTQLSALKRHLRFQIRCIQ